MSKQLTESNYKKSGGYKGNNRLTDVLPHLWRLTWEDPKNLVDDIWLELSNSLMLLVSAGISLCIFLESTLVTNLSSFLFMLSSTPCRWSRWDSGVRGEADDDLWFSTLIWSVAGGLTIELDLLLCWTPKSIRCQQFVRKCEE